MQQLLFLFFIFVFSHRAFNKYKYYLYKEPLIVSRSECSCLFFLSLICTHLKCRIVVVVVFFTHFFFRILSKIFFSRHEPAFFHIFFFFLGNQSVPHFLCLYGIRGEGDWGHLYKKLRSMKEVLFNLFFFLVCTMTWISLFFNIKCGVGRDVVLSISIKCACKVFLFRGRKFFFSCRQPTNVLQP